PGDGEDERGTVRGGTDRRPVLGIGEEGAQVLGDGDGADAGPAAPVGDREGLVQVQVGDVAAEFARVGPTEERVEVRAVDIDLPAGVVHGGAALADPTLVHAVGRVIGDHDRPD